MITREEDFQQVRRLLDFPMEQRPENDLIVCNQLRTERQLLNEANGQNQGWSPKTKIISSVANQAEYEITATGHTVGKALFAYRDLGSNNILPVPFTDFLSEISNQSYDFWLGPVLSGQIPNYSGEQLGFYRDNEKVMMRIYPIPESVKTYTIVYGIGIMDWTTLNWTDVPAFPEYSDYRQLLTALRTIKSCEWEGLSIADSRTKRMEIREDLTAEMQIFEREWRAFIRNTKQEEQILELANWWET